MNIYNKHFSETNKVNSCKSIITAVNQLIWQTVQMKLILDKNIQSYHPKIYQSQRSMR